MTVLVVRTAPGDHTPNQEDTMPCCDLHNQHCEPPGDLCCHRCTEAAHPDHRPGERCVIGAVAGATPTTSPTA